MIGYAINGVTRLLHFVRTKNLPYSTDDVKKVCHSCRICAELIPQFHRPQQNTLIKATQPMERRSIDFKGPLRSSSQNTYMLTIVDEYFRFPFAFPCPNTTSATVMKCLDKMFVLCGTPSYIHSDRGSSFLSHEKRITSLKEALPQAKPLQMIFASSAPLLASFRVLFHLGGWSGTINILYQWLLCQSSFALWMISWRVLFPSSSIFIRNGLDLSFDGLPNLRKDSIRGTRLNSSFMMFRNVCSSLS